MQLKWRRSLLRQVGRFILDLLGLCARFVPGLLHAANLAQCANGRSRGFQRRRRPPKLPPPRVNSAGKAFKLAGNPGRLMGALMGDADRRVCQAASNVSSHLPRKPHLHALLQLRAELLRGLLEALGRLPGRLAELGQLLGSENQRRDAGDDSQLGNAQPKNALPANESARLRYPPAGPPARLPERQGGPRDGSGRVSREASHGGVATHARPSRRETNHKNDTRTLCRACLRPRCQRGSRRAPTHLDTSRLGARSTRRATRGVRAAS